MKNWFHWIICHFLFDLLENQNQDKEESLCFFEKIFIFETIDQKKTEMLWNDQMLYPEKETLKRREIEMMIAKKETWFLRDFEFLEEREKVCVGVLC